MFIILVELYLSQIHTGRLFDVFFFFFFFFFFCCNTIRASWETKKEILSCRKRCIDKFEWRTSLLAGSPSFLCHFLLFLSTPSLSSTLILCGKIFSFALENNEEGAPASFPPAPQYLQPWHIKWFKWNEMKIYFLS